MTREDFGEFLACEGIKDNNLSYFQFPKSNQIPPSPNKQGLKPLFLKGYITLKIEFCSKRTYIRGRTCFLGGSEVKVSASNVGDPGLIPGLGRSPGEGNGNPLQYSCLENSMDGGAWQATVHGVAKSQTRLSDFTSLLMIAQ